MSYVQYPMSHVPYPRVLKKFQTIKTHFQVEIVLKVTVTCYFLIQISTNEVVSIEKIRQ